MGYTQERSSKVLLLYEDIDMKREFVSMLNIEVKTVKQIKVNTEGYRTDMYLNDASE